MAKVFFPIKSNKNLFEYPFDMNLNIDIKAKHPDNANPIL